MNTQDMVFAEKFILARVNGKWDTSTRTSKGVKLVPRQWVEDRNVQDNNEYYVIDEERSKGIPEAREANAIKNAERIKRKEVSQGDMVEALAAAIKGSSQEKPKVTKPKPSPKKEVEKNNQEGIDLAAASIDDMKAYCDDNGIEYHHKAGHGKLIELIQEAGGQDEA